MRRFGIVLPLMGLLLAISRVEADFDFLKINTPLMNSMLANTTSFDNELNILRAKKGMKPGTITVGGYAQGGFNGAYPNKRTFFYSDNLTFKSRNYVSLDRVALAILPNFTDWASIYFEIGAIDIGQSYASNFMINQFYVLLGDGVFPLYGFGGYKNIDFGKFQTVNIFAQPTTRWDYAGTALTAGIGYLSRGVNVTLSVLQGGAKGREDYYGSGLWRVYNYPNYYTTGAPNIAVNASYGNTIASMNWNVGIGYMRGLWLGSPANGFNKANIGAWDVNAQIYYRGLTLLGEWVQSFPKTTSFGIFTPTQDNGALLQTWDVGVSYEWSKFLFPRLSTLRADVSGIIGNSSFAQAIQVVLGFTNNFLPYLTGGIEYVFITQTSNQNANRSGLFYRAHNKLQVVRVDLTLAF